MILALAPVEGLSVQNALAGVIETLSMAPGGQVDVVLALGPTRIVARVSQAARNRLKLAPGQAIHALIKSVATDRLL